MRALLAATDEVKRRPEPHFPLIAKTVNQSVDWVTRSWRHHAFPGALPNELLDVMVEEERWVAQEPEARAALAGGAPGVHRHERPGGGAARPAAR